MVRKLGRERVKVRSDALDFTHIFRIVPSPTHPKISLAGPSRAVAAGVDGLRR
ncbi:hypothetical protein CYLTODRAFT_425710 [Cylindrobasidium torrendii FP15055 ss-10]|uniref:Uncharacterized protein n=1 Tax=Cylindrobasidium torrendii FP15055 ss-10 TaxID=1314674 RepID=A0A0D7B117_9AGAR|nr:hypothetical protein CYLTODRAFT_425710 [Cylindrobasidium torrendii FP15055 ss-10]